MASVNWGTIASSNDLSRLHRQAITWTNGDLLPHGQLGTTLEESESDNNDSIQ